MLVYRRRRDCVKREGVRGAWRNCLKLPNHPPGEDPPAGGCSAAPLRRSWVLSNRPGQAPDLKLERRQGSLRSFIPRPILPPTMHLQHLFFVQNVSIPRPSTELMLQEPTCQALYEALAPGRVDKADVASPRVSPVLSRPTNLASNHAIIPDRLGPRSSCVNLSKSFYLSGLVLSIK